MIKKLDGPSGESVSVLSCAFEIMPGNEEDAEYIDDKLVEYNWSQVPPEREFELFGK